MTTRFRYLVYGLLAISLLGTSCQDDTDATPSVKYEQVGDMKIAGISGFGLNGDLLALGNDKQPLRWRHASQDWLKLGTNFIIPLYGNIAPYCEDPQGNYYGFSNGKGPYVLLPGATLWQPLALPGVSATDARVANRPYGNTSGDVVVQVRAVLPTGVRDQIYRKAAAATTWVLLNDRPQDPEGDPLTISAYANNGDVFLEHGNRPSNPPVVLKNGTSALADVTACAGAIVLPYCTFGFAISPSGDVTFSNGGTGSRKVYNMKAPGTYPGTATYVYDLPDEACSLFYDHLLNDGTFLGIANDCRYGEYFLFMHKPGASTWYKAPSLPGFPSAQIVVSPRDEVYTTSQSGPNLGHFVYRIKY